jgi:hypothetical protein
VGTFCPPGDVLKKGDFGKRKKKSFVKVLKEAMAN